MGLILVTSAGDANGAGHDSLLCFNEAGDLLGPFSDDRRIADPRGLTLDPSGSLIYLNSADRMLALDRRSGCVVHDSGPTAALDPGGAVFGPDGRFYVTARRRRTILGIVATLDGDPEPLLPEGVVPFPRGFGFGPDLSLYLASGIGPSGEGDNTILAVDFARRATRPLVRDPELSPLDLTVAPNNHIVVASEYPFGAVDAEVTIREYEPANGRLVRVFAAAPSLNFRRPRGVRFGPDGVLYCVGEGHLVAFDFETGTFLGPAVEMPRLNGQAVVILD